jgi:hypothetical protein
MNIFTPKIQRKYASLVFKYVISSLAMSMWNKGVHTLGAWIDVEIVNSIFEADFYFRSFFDCLGSVTATKLGKLGSNPEKVFLGHESYHFCKRNKIVYMYMCNKWISSRKMYICMYLQFTYVPTFSIYPIGEEVHTYLKPIICKIYDLLFHWNEYFSHTLIRRDHYHLFIWLSTEAFSAAIAKISHKTGFYTKTTAHFSTKPVYLPM